MLYVLQVRSEDGKSWNLDAMKPDGYNVKLSQQLVCYFHFLIWDPPNFSVLLK